METLQQILYGFGVALQPINLLFCFLGAVAGTLVGVLPGLGPTAAMAMLLPVTFGIPPTGAVIMLAGIYYGAQYGGSTTSILVNIPGEAASVVTCLDGYVFLDSFEAQKVQERANHRLLKKVKVWIDREVKDPGSLGPVTVEIRVRSGETYSETVEEFKGHPRNRMTEEECRNKFIQCAAYSIRPFSRGSIEKIIERVLRLETLKNTNDLMALL